MAPKKLKSIFLDMDGTLANSLPMLFDSYRQFMQGFNLAATQIEFQELTFFTLRESVALLKERYSLSQTEDELYQLLTGNLEHYYETKIPFYDHVHPFIDYFFERGIKLALVTAAAEQLAEKLLVSQGVRSKFIAIISSQGLKKSKPAPDVYLKALEDLELTGEEVVAIEDSSSGLQAALAAKIPTIWISHNMNEIPDHIQNGLYGKVHNWQECLSFLRNKR